MAEQLNMAEQLTWYNIRLIILFFYLRQATVKLSFYLIKVSARLHAITIISQMIIIVS